MIGYSAGNSIKAQGLIYLENVSGRRNREIITEYIVLIEVIMDKEGIILARWERLIIYPLLMVFLFALIAGLPSLHADPEIKEEIRARRIALVNENNDEIAVLRVNPAGGARFGLFNSEGLELVSLGETSQGNGAVIIYDKNGENPIVLTMEDGEQ